MLKLYHNNELICIGEYFGSKIIENIDKIEFEQDKFDEMIKEIVYSVDAKLKEDISNIFEIFSTK